MEGTDHVLERHVRVPCAECGATATEVLLEGTHGRWHFRYGGIEAGNGAGDEITYEHAAQISSAFTEPLDYDRVRTAGLFDDAGFCEKCRVAYCFEHWDSSDGYGTCPNGHGKSLDPHWSPDF